MFGGQTEETGSSFAGAVSGEAAMGADSGDDVVSFPKKCRIRQTAGIIRGFRFLGGEPGSSLGAFQGSGVKAPPKPRKPGLLLRSPYNPAPAGWKKITAHPSAFHKNTTVCTD